MPKASTSYKKGSLVRALAILDTFSIVEPELGVREIARRTGITSSTIGRICSALHDAGVLSQNPENRKYRIGPKVLQWAWVFEQTVNLRDIVLPVMEELRGITKETISLYIVQGHHRMCIEWLRSPHSMRYDTRPGELMPLHCGAGGKALLAHLNDERREIALQPENLISYTDSSITNRSEIERELEKIREQGFAISQGEFVEGVVSIASPICDSDGKVIAAISISGPRARIKEHECEQYSRLILEAAQKISLELGCEQIGYKTDFLF
jgi:IclR family KDG regulon transcriptional repressor